MAGYGSDTWCLGSLRLGKVASGVDLVVQALYRRTITPRGALRGLGEDGDEGGDEDELAYGFDLCGYIGAVGTDTAIRSIPTQLRGEFLKDDRVSDAVITPFVSVDNGQDYSLELSVDAVLADSGEAFAFSLGVSETAVTLLGVSA